MFSLITTKACQNDKGENLSSPPTLLSYLLNCNRFRIDDELWHEMLATLRPRRPGSALFRASLSTSSVNTEETRQDDGSCGCTHIKIEKAGDGQETIKTNCLSFKAW